MQRRDLLKMIAAATGVAMVGIDLHAREAGVVTAPVLLPADQGLLDEIAETILPQSDTPGGKAAACGAAIVLFVNDCYQSAQQQQVKAGLLEIRALSKTRYGKDFVALDAKERHELLAALDAVAKNGGEMPAGGSSLASSKTTAKPGEPHYFTLLKQLVLFTFFTSKPGATEVLRYVAVPGRYDGAMPYKKGDRGWAT